MGFYEGIRLAFATIWTHKLRSGLTLLANVVAVTSVIAVVSILAGMDQYVKDTVVSEGTGILRVERLNPIEVITNFDKFLESIHNPRLKSEDAEYLGKRMKLAEYVGAGRGSSARVEVGSRFADDVSIRGRTAEYPYIQVLELAAGRHIVPLEVKRRAPVAVIGHSVAEALFPYTDPIDQVIRIRGKHLRVVGVVEEQGISIFDNPNRFVYVPLGMFEKMFGSWESVAITIKVIDVDQIREAMEEARFFMRIRHGLRPSDREDFAIMSSGNLIELWENISRGIFMTITGIAAISLVIGGIVIMNIMLVSVTERTREIGVRKAVGARRSGILWQVIAESMAMSTLGGVVGILLGFIAASLLAAFSPLPYAIEAWSIVAGLLVTASSGFIFGFYPANRAARLDPIEALRVE